jgi:predicted AAA+ superfamily ATPase
MIKSPKEFRTELEKQNEWWITRRVKEAEAFPTRRAPFVELKKDLELKWVTLVIGPRRVGKTILLKHLIHELMAGGIDEKNIVFYSLDDPAILMHCDNPIKDIFDYWYENIAGAGRKFFFLDEVHEFREWYKWIKAIYDRYPDVKIVLSGSSSLALQREANRFLRGRSLEHEVFPQTFREFLKLGGKDAPRLDIQQVAKMQPLDAKRLYVDMRDDLKEYLLVGGFPEWFEVKDRARWMEMLRAIVSKKAIYEDVVTLFDIKSPRTLELVLTFIVANQSKVLAYESINRVAKLKHEILVNYIEYLKASYLIIEILKFAGLKEQLKAKKKYLCVDQGLRNALLSEHELKEDNVGFVIENVVGSHTYLECKRKKLKLMYHRVNDEVDFIVGNKALVPIEVKYKESIDKKELKPLLKFMEEHGCKEAFVITKDIFERRVLDDKTLVFVPACLYLLTV